MGFLVRSGGKYYVAHDFLRLVGESISTSSDFFERRFRLLRRLRRILSTSWKSIGSSSVPDVEKPTYESHSATALAYSHYETLLTRFLLLQYLKISFVVFVVRPSRAWNSFNEHANVTVEHIIQIYLHSFADGRRHPIVCFCFIIIWRIQGNDDRRKQPVDSFFYSCPLLKPWTGLLMKINKN